MKVEFNQPLPTITVGGHTMTIEEGITLAKELARILDLTEPKTKSEVCAAQETDLERLTKRLQELQKAQEISNLRRKRDPWQDIKPMWPGSQPTWCGKDPTPPPVMTYFRKED